MSDVIERQIELRAPVERVWRAIGDSAEFGRWFGVAIDGLFVEGQPVSGQMTHAGYEHVRWAVTVVAYEAPHHLAFTWHPYAVDPAFDYSGEEPTLVEFLLESADGGTRLTVRESGFDRVPASRREEAMRMNSRGWDAQTANVAAYVDG